MRKYISLPLLLIHLVVTAAMLGACSGSAGQTEESPSQSLNPPTKEAGVASGSCSLALLLPGSAESDSNLQAGIKESASQDNCQVEVYAAEGSPQSMAAQIQQAVQKKYSGIIIKPIDDVNVGTAIQQVQGLPVVLIGAEELPSIQSSRVIPNFVEGAAKAAVFICRAIHEHGNIVQLADSRIDTDGQVSKAFSSQAQATCPAANLTTITLQDSNEAAAKDSMRGVLSANPDISAVFAYTEGAMNGVLSANQEAGIMGVITAEFEQVGGTIRAVDASVHASSSETGKAAVQAALAQINGAAAQPIITTPMDVSVSDMGFQLPPDPMSKSLTIGVILPDGVDPFYQQMYIGLLNPARAMDNVTLKVRAGNNDPQKMIQDLEWMVNIKVDAILIAPVEDAALFEAMNKIINSGIPMVTMGVAVDNKKIISQIRFDEYAAGYKAGEYLCSALGGQGVIADIYDSQNPEKEMVRSSGLLDYQQQNCPNVKVISHALPVGSQAACAELQKFLSESEPVTGIFAHTDALGLCAADTSRAKFVIGIGTSAQTIEAVKAGRLSATLGQHPYEMGLIAMEATIEHLYGKQVEPDKPFPVDLISTESLK